MLSKEELKALGEEGIIPGPEESEEAFVKRVEILRSQQGQEIEGKKLESWNLDCQSLYGAHPQWIPLTYSNRGLLPWQGAALWVYGEKVPLIQLRTGFRKGHFLFYSREEVLKHETLHAMRVAFEEPRFEEILAYSHARSKWRQYLGPLFRKPSQTLFFIALIVLSLVIQTTSLLFLSSPFLPFIRVVSILPIVDLAIRFASLWRDRRVLAKALKKLALLFPNRKDVFPIAIRLKDSEIQRFATDPVEKLLEYLEEEVPRSLRIRQVLAQFC
ncbi:MAG: hypothetical protein KDK64_02595 [Chlamydiia bacterium]|nr:hypothetical protein [Chlamydiia bacterium]